MKEIMLSIKPKWVAKILKGDKTSEIRKQFPKDYEGWVYIYCSKNGAIDEWDKDFFDKANFKLKKGKVVGKFYCSEIGVVIHHKNMYISKYQNRRKTCLWYEDYKKYLGDNDDKILGYEIPIDLLHIFETPKDLADFGIKKAPQNYCYIKTPSTIATTIERAISSVVCPDISNI